MQTILKQYEPTVEKPHFVNTRSEVLHVLKSNPKACVDLEEFLGIMASQFNKGKSWKEGLITIRTILLRNKTKW
jgi:hypothetical protein